MEKAVNVRKERDKSEEFLVEGFHLVEEAIKEKENVLTIIVSERSEIPDIGM